MKGPDEARDLAVEISALLSGKPMPVAACALVEVLAILIAATADEVWPKAKVAKLLTDQALALAEALPPAAFVAADKAAAAEKRRVAELLKSAGPKQASPWGEP